MTVSAVVLARSHAMCEQARRTKLGTRRGLVDATQAREHVNDLRRVWHVSYRAVGDVAQVSAGTLRHLVLGSPGRKLLPPARIRADVSDAILTVTVDDLPDSYRINPVGATRRLRALAFAGFPLSEVAGRAPAHITGLKKLRAGTKQQITVELNRRLKVLYDELIDTDPHDAGVHKSAITQARNLARKEGWFPAVAWADDIDDPEIKPWTTVRCSISTCIHGAKDERLLCAQHLRVQRQRGTLEGLRAVRNNKVLIEDARFILATDPPIDPVTENIDRDRLAERLGTSWETLEKALERAGINLDKLRESA